MKLPADLAQRGAGSRRRYAWRRQQAAIAKARCQDRCESCGAPALDAHHVWQQQLGEPLRSHHVSLVGLCRDCHADVHRQPGEARELALMTLSLARTLREFRLSDQQLAEDGQDARQWHLDCARQLERQLQADEPAWQALCEQAASQR